MKNTIRELRKRRGWSQADLAQKLGVSRQTVNALESGRSDPALSLAFRLSWLLEEPLESIFLFDLEEKMRVLQQRWEYQDRLAVGFDEAGVLEKLGAEGWEMVGFGPLNLHFRRPEDAGLRVQWEHKRVGAQDHAANQASYAAEGWIYCGSWMGVMYYYKRPVQTKRPVSYSEDA